MKNDFTISKRLLLKRLMALSTLPLLVNQANAMKRTSTSTVVRISRGTFQAKDYERIKTMLDQSQASLIPAIKQLSGLLHYHAGIDAVSNTMINVSVWQSLEDAEQMATLAPMLALADSFINAGVSFERPINNYETLWKI